jgi:uncharacterized protein YqjF (DUF2071 family)
MQPGRFLTTEWRYLVMLNYEIDPAVLLPYVPPGTELDSWNGNTYVSVVGLLFLRTRVLGMAIPRHRNFEEVNLRFYVRRKGEEGWLRGVVFIKEIVALRAVATIARVVYNEQYFAMPMRYNIEGQNGRLKRNGLVEYSWFHQGRWCRLRARADGDLQEIADGSQEEFITEHYWGYARQRSGGCVEYRVEHPRWRIWPVGECLLDCNVATLYGDQFAEYLDSTPASAFLAQGSPVIVRRGRRI